MADDAIENSTNTTSPPDFYIARGESGFAIEIEKQHHSFDNSFGIYTRNTSGDATNSSGMTETEVNSKLTSLIEHLQSKGFTLEEHFYPTGQETETPDYQERATNEVPSQQKDTFNNPPSDEPLNQNNLERTEQTEPETTKDQNSDSFGDKLDNDVEEFFGNGQRANDILKGQLDEYVDEGGNPILAALGGTGLDVLGGAMGFADSTIRGLIDTRNLGEGLKKGTLAGVKEDAGRLLNVLPQGRAARILGNVLTVTDLAEAANNDDSKGLATSGSFSLIMGLGQFPNSKQFKSLRVRGKRKGKPKLGKYAKKELPKRQREWITKRIKELREKGHGDDYIRKTIRGQIAEVGLDLDAKTYNNWIEQFLKKR